MRVISNHDRDPAYQARIARLHEEHEANDPDAQWLGKSVVELQDRLDAGDPDVQVKGIHEELSKNIEFLEATQHTSRDRHLTISDFISSSAFRIIGNIEKLHPHTKQFLKEKGFVTKNDEPDSSHSVDELASLISKIRNDTPHELYIDILRLRLEHARDHVVEYTELVQELKQEFIDELPDVAAELNLPIDLEIARQRIEHINIAIIDPLVNVPRSAIYRRNRGYYDFQTDKLAIDFDLFEQGRDFVKQVVTHELYHAISGQSAQTNDSGQMQEQRIGLIVLGVRSEDTKRVETRFGWLNEAVTESITHQHLEHRELPVKKRAYLREIDLMQVMLDNAGNRKEELRRAMLDAYFSNTTDAPVGERQTALRAFSQMMREIYGESALLELDQLVQLGRFEGAKYYLQNPNRTDVKVVRKMAQEQLYPDWYVRDLKEIGHVALAMLAGHQAADPLIMAKGIQAAIMDYCDDPEQERTPLQLSGVIYQFLKVAESG